MARPRIVVVGAGFAGFTAARKLTKLSRGGAEIVLINPTDYFLYLPLLPEVAAGRARAAPGHRLALPRPLPGVRVVLGEVDEFDLDGRTVGWRDPEGGTRHDRLPPPRHRRGQRQQAAAGAGRDRVCARLPRHPRGAFPARPDHPADRDGRHRVRRTASAGPGAPSSSSGPATPAPRWRRRACSTPSGWSRSRPELAGKAAVAAGRHGRPGAADTRRTAGPGCRAGAAPARGGGPDRDQRQGGEPRRRPPVRPASTCRPGR